jgi:protein-disulfide isomerase
VVALVLAGLMAGASGAAYAEGMTKEQGDTIINELRQIRQLLGRQPTQQAAPAQPETPERVRIKLGKEFSLGKSDAPVVMMEYTDYQCPFCNRFYTGAFPELKKQYIETGKMRFITRDFPLEFHPHALKAAQASHCAGEQGKFWEMKDALMTNSARLSPEVIVSLAKEQGVEMDKFNVCMGTGRYLADIAEEQSAAKAAGIGGTPSFIIGRVSGDYLDGYLVVGAQPFQNFDAVAKKVLSETK